MPSLAELVVALDGGADRLVGVSDHSDHPVALKKVTSVGPYPQVNLEQVRALRPDLIIASRNGNSRDQVERLRSWGYHVELVSSATLSDVEDSISQISRVVGSEKSGQELLKSFRDLRLQVQLTGQRVPAPRRKRVMVQLGEDPVIVVGSRTHLHEALKLAGAENIYGDREQEYPRVSAEDVLQRNPDLILIPSLSSDVTALERMKRGWDRFPSLKANRSGAVQVLEADDLLRPGPRLMEGVLRLQRVIYPELYVRTVQ